MKTWNAQPGEVEQKWYVVDATGKTLGRMSTEIAKIIRGKNKPTFTPHVNTGDFVVVINAEKVKMSNNEKWNTEKYYSHSRYFGSLKELSMSQMRDKDAANVIVEAVQGMLPKTKLSKKVIQNLKAYKGPNHPHAAQKPELLNIDTEN